MRFFTVASALIGAVAANNLEARWPAVTHSASVSASASACPPASTVTVTAWGPPPGGKGSWGNGTAATPTPTKALYVNGADSITYGAWTVVAGIAAAMLI